MVSIIIVNYNTKKFIIPCLESIKKYAPQETEIIVVDNASTDDSIAVTRNLKLKIKNLKLIESKENLGYAKAVNQGIKASTGDYLFVLNPDTRLTSGAIDTLINLTLLHKSVTMIGPRLLNPDGYIQPSCYHEPTIWGATKEYFLNVKGSFVKFAPKSNYPVKVDAVVGAAMFIPRQVINKVGMFNEKYFMYFEDLDYCRRVRLGGLSVYYLPKAQIYHEHGAVTKTVPKEAMSWLVESSKVYHGVVKHYLLNFILWLGQKWQKILNLNLPKLL